MRRDQPWLWAVTTGGLGLLRPAPGTWGSLPPAALAAVFVLLDAPMSVQLTAFLSLAIGFSAITVGLGDRAAAGFGRPDPGQVVSDETAGQAVTCIMIPHLHDAGHHPWGWIVLPAAAFFAFRFFDIVKPPPANGLQRLPAGWGILLDDLVAGVMAMPVVWLVAVLFL